MQERKDFVDFVLTVIKALIEISFLVGSILLALYFISIKYAPFLTFSETVWIIILVFLLGLLILVFLGFILFLPGLYLRYLLVSIKSESTSKEQQEKQQENFDSLLFIFAFPFLFSYILLFIYWFCMENLSSFSIIPFISLFIFCFFSRIALDRIDIKIKTKVKIYFSAAVTGCLAFISFWLNILVFINLIEITSKSDYFWLLIPGMLSILSIYIISTTEKNFIKVFLFILITIPIGILLIFDKIDIIYKNPIKLLNLGNVNVTLILDENYANLLKKEMCKQFNSQNTTLCNLLNESILKGFLLFRTPKGYLIEIKDSGIQKKLFIKESFVNFSFFEHIKPDKPHQGTGDTASR